MRLREFAERYTAAWCSQDAASVAAFFSPAARLPLMAVPRRWGETPSPRPHRVS